ncbi:MAG: LamG-like jellyroll fold domain-containing protein, partial [Bacteroidales bacterium]
MGQTGPGGISKDNGNEDLKLWLQSDRNINYSDGGRVNRWYDVSGYDFHFDSTSTRPRYEQSIISGLPVVDFSNDDAAGLEIQDFDISNFLATGDDAITLIFVKQSEGGQTWFNWQTEQGNRVGFDLSSSNASFQYADSETTGDIPITDDTFHIVTGMKTSSDQYIYIDGAMDSKRANNNSLDGIDTDDLFLGTKDGTSTDGWQGQIAEVIVFDRALDTTERLIVDNYLAAKYDLDLPADYDKYEGDTDDNDNYDFDVVGIGNANGTAHLGSSSAGVRISDPDNTIDAGEFVFIGHDNTHNRVDTTDMIDGVEARWRRDWYVDVTKDDGIDNLQMSFDLSEGVDGSVPGDSSNYVLLKWDVATAEYDTVGVTKKDIENGTRIYFQLPDDNLTDGYYTLGTTDKSNSPVGGGKTWYTYYQGEWDEWVNWTLDPGATNRDNPNRLTPGAADTVVILNGWQIDMNEDNRQVGAIEIREGARLNLDTTKNHNFGRISGSGKIKLAAGEFPEGDATDFSNNGILEYMGADYTVSEALDIKEMVVNLSASDDTLTFVDSVTVSENLIIQRGNFQINDHSSTDRLNIVVGNDVDVKTGGSISVGTADAFQNNTDLDYGNYHESYHTFEVYGDFLNNGIVELTNLSDPDFGTRASNGAVSLFFRGSSDNEFRCKDTVKLYNLVIDKGSDQTFELNLHSDDVGYFALFGKNNNQWNEKNPDDPNPEMQKALWIKSGTLRLTGNIFIPSLTEGRESTDHSGDYVIGANAALVLDDPGVEINNTANEDSDFSGYPYDPQEMEIDDGNSWQGLYILGKFQVNDGYYWLGKAEAINFRDESPGELIVKGGELKTNQIGISSFATAGGVYSFYQSGGIVRITGAYTPDGNRAMMHLAEPEMTFTQKGGQIILENVSGNDPNGIYIASKEGNYSTLGGEVVIDYGGNFQINTTASFYDFTVINGDVSLQTPLTVLNDLTLQDNQSLTMNDYGLEIGRDFNLNNGATYDHGNNT